MPKLSFRLSVAFTVALTAALVTAGCGQQSTPLPGPTSAVKPIILGVYKFTPVPYLKAEQTSRDCADLSYHGTLAQACALTAKQQETLSANISFAGPKAIGPGFMNQAEQTGAKVDRPPLRDLRTPPESLKAARQSPIAVIKAQGDVVTVFRSTENQDPSSLTAIVVRHQGSGSVRPSEILVAGVNSDENPGPGYDAHQQQLLYGLLASLKAGAGK